MLVTRIVRDGAGKVTGVEVRDQQTGQDQTVLSRYVVVAGDALRTPQLLCASGIRPPALGRYLNDQPQTVFAVRLRDVDNEPERAAVGTEILPQCGVSSAPFTDDEPFHGQVMQMDASPVPLAGDDVPAPGSIVGLGWFCAKDLQPSDRVEFDSSEVDSYGLPAMRIHYTPPSPITPISTPPELLS